MRGSGVRAWEQELDVWRRVKVHILGTAKALCSRGVDVHLDTWL